MRLVSFTKTRLWFYGGEEMLWFYGGEETDRSKIEAFFTNHKALLWTYPPKIPVELVVSILIDVPMKFPSRSAGEAPSRSAGEDDVSIRR